MKNRLKFGYLYRKNLVVGALLVLDALLSLIPFRKRSPPRAPLKILIVKPDHLGDCLLSSAALRAIDMRFPTARIDYLAGPWGANVLCHYPRINKIWKIRHAQHNRGTKGLQKWLDFWSDLKVVLPQIRAERYDAVLFLRASGGNFVFMSRLMNARFLAGHGAGGGRALLDQVANWIQGSHEVEHYNEVLRLLDAEVEASLPFFACSTTALPDLPKDYVCVHPGAGADNKKLTPNSWTEVLAGSALPLVVCGTSEDGNWLRALVLEPQRIVIDLTSGLQIPDLFRVFANARQTHALDSFPAHLAAVSPCPGVCVHFLTVSDPIQWRPLGPNVEVVLHESP